MVFRRLYNILRANVSSGTGSSSEYYHSQRESYNFQEKQVEQDFPVQDPAKIRELEYLLNLELKEGADFDEIKLAYKRLVRVYHPDKFHSDETKRKFAEEVTSKLNEAYAYFEKKYEKS